MTIQFPDVSQFTPVSLAGAPVAIARATIGLVKDSNYDRFVADAAAHGVPLLAYHFLDDEALGATPEAQADFCYSVVGRRALMLDDEPNRGYCASLAQSQRFINRFRGRGGIVHLDYLPKWSWSGWMGSPSLQPLQQLGVYVVSSNYTAYSDTGPGWSAYGGVTPAQWQFADNHLFNGVACDWNAFRGTTAAYLALADGTDQGGFMGTTDNIIGAWAQGNVTGAGGEDVEPVRWRIRDELWQKTVSDALTALLQNLTAAAGQEKTDVAQILASLQAAPAAQPVDVQALAADITAGLIASNANGLTQADHDGVKADVAAVLAEQLSQIRLTTAA